eukprot:gene11000-biopygen7812
MFPIPPSFVASTPTSLFAKRYIFSSLRSFGSVHCTDALCAGCNPQKKDGGQIPTGSEPKGGLRAGWRCSKRGAAGLGGDAAKRPGTMTSRNMLLAPGAQHRRGKPKSGAFNWGGIEEGRQDWAYGYVPDSLIASPRRDNSRHNTGGVISGGHNDNYLLAPPAAADHNDYYHGCAGRSPPPPKSASRGGYSIAVPPAERQTQPWYSNMSNEKTFLGLWENVSAGRRTWYCTLFAPRASEGDPQCPTRENRPREHPGRAPDAPHTIEFEETNTSRTRPGRVLDASRAVSPRVAHRWPGPRGETRKTKTYRNQYGKLRHRHGEKAGNGENAAPCGPPMRRRVNEETQHHRRNK